MIVFVAGMQRSGSTFSFNVVRELLERRGTIHTEDISYLPTILDQKRDVEHLVFKGHSADELTLQLVRLGAVKVVCTIRRPEDAIASWMETFGFELAESIHVMSEWLKMFDRLRHYAIVVPYEVVDHRPWLAARAIGKYISKDASFLETTRIARRYSKLNMIAATKNIGRDGINIKDIGFTYYDKKTLFHRRHVSMIHSLGAGDRLDSKAVIAIRAALTQWVDDSGILRKL